MVRYNRRSLWRSRLYRTMNTIKIYFEFILRYILSRMLAKTLRTNGIIIVFLCIMCTTLDAGSLLPSIDRIRKKVENTVNTQTSNFKNILTQAGINDNIIRGPILLQGEQANKIKELNLQDIEKAFNDLYWSNQKQFVDKLAQQMKQSEVQAALLLKQKVREKYTALKTPILTYAQDLANEEKQLDDLFQAWLRLSNTSSMNIVNKALHIKKLKALYDRHVILKQTLENLTKITNTLLA